MIPSRHAYYRNRAREHRRLALVATEPEARQMHDRLTEAYINLARQSLLRQVVRLKT
jgi:hypothetical protein